VIEVSLQRELAETAALYAACQSKFSSRFGQLRLDESLFRLFRLLLRRGPDKKKAWVNEPNEFRLVRADAERAVSLCRA
jgi:hypothetical protein